MYSRSARNPGEWVPKVIMDADVPVVTNMLTRTHRCVTSGTEQSMDVRY